MSVNYLVRQTKYLIFIIFLQCFSSLNGHIPVAHHQKATNLKAITTTGTVPKKPIQPNPAPVVAQNRSQKPLADWTFLVFVQANNSLSGFAQKNFVDMATIGSSNSLNILVEWHQPNKPGIWRYRIERNKMVLDSCVPTHPTDGTKAEDLVSSMQWATTNYPAQQYCLTFWNHGLGILDPAWNDTYKIINPRVLNQQHRMLFDNEPPTRSLQKKQPHTKNVRHLNGHPQLPSRAILFNEETQTYMNNSELTKALKTIKTSLLNNKKIDLIGMDACLMAMVEVAYQIHDYAEYLVGSQEVEFAYGWNYATVLGALNSEASTPELAAKNIVTSFSQFYKNKIPFYTQSAIDLSKIAGLKDALHAFSTRILGSKALNTDNSITLALKAARSKCLQFSATSYIDLHSFLSEFQTHLSFAYSKKRSKSSTDRNEYETLTKSTSIALSALETSIIANSTGEYLTRAKGLSIYYPTQKMDNSYQTTAFAKDCEWFSLLKSVLSGD